MAVDKYVGRTYRLFVHVLIHGHVVIVHNSIAGCFDMILWCGFAYEKNVEIRGFIVDIRDYIVRHICMIQVSFMYEQLSDK